MARTKQATPLRREPSSEYTSKADRPPAYAEKGLASGVEVANGNSNGTLNGRANGKEMKHASANGEEIWKEKEEKKQAGLLQLIIGVGGIYASFLTWALLQERLTTTPYGATATSPGEKFSFPIFLNTIQSLLAALTGTFYLYLTTPRGTPLPSPIPNRQILIPLIAVALTTSLASPFGYASLAHIDYITFILAKSCKLVPVMVLHVALFGKRYPLYKYGVVAAVTAGVAVFTLHGASTKSSKSHSSSSTTGEEKHRLWGLLLLAVNLLLDGLTNTTQDHIFAKFKGYTGPQMMVANNVLSTMGTLAWLLFLGPLVSTSGLGVWLGLSPSSSSSSSSSTTTTTTTGSGSSEILSALQFLTSPHHTTALFDVLGFSLCGAIGQIFIFYTLSNFSSILLVTVTVTRKMVTMILSVLWFGHSLSRGQWVGVGLVFGGVGAEAAVARRERLLRVKAGPKKEL